MKNKILLAISNVAVCMMLFGIGAFDSEKAIIPIVMTGIGMAWITLFAFANKGGKNEYLSD